MSMTIWLNVRTGDTHECGDQDLSALFALSEQLDAIADKLAVQPISNFFDDTDVRYNMDEVGEFEESEDGWPASAATWHDAAVVLRTAEALRAHLEANGNVLDETDGWTLDQVLEDLTTLIPGLVAAVKAKRQVHLLVVM